MDSAIVSRPLTLAMRLGLYLVAAVLFLAGLDKLFHYAGFVNALRSYILVPTGWADFLAAPVIGVEMVVAVALLLPATRSMAAAGAAILLAVFTAALSADLWLGNQEVCGCWFSVTVAPGGWHVFQNLILIALAANGWNELRRRGRPSHLAAPSLSGTVPYRKESKHERAA